METNGVGHLPKKRPRVLIADDNYFIVSVLRQTLSERGIDVLTAYTAEEFRLQWKDVDVIVLDIRLPEREGEVIKDWVGLQALQSIQETFVASGPCPLQIENCILHSGQNTQDAIGAQVKVPRHFRWLPPEATTMQLLDSIEDVLKLHAERVS